MDEELIRREAVRQIYREEVCRVKDIRDLEPFINRIESLPTVEHKPISPCDVCRYNPPSSGDGKPCTMCPAEGRW